MYQKFFQLKLRKHEVDFLQSWPSLSIPTKLSDLLQTSGHSICIYVHKVSLSTLTEKMEAPKDKE